VTFGLPKKTDIIGVMRSKWPVTVTVTVLPRPAAHDAGLQVRSTSAGSIVTKPPTASLTTRHMTCVRVGVAGGDRPGKASGIVRQDGGGQRSFACGVFDGDLRVEQPTEVDRGPRPAAA
jgi:hypothetical protein